MQRHDQPGDRVSVGKAKLQGVGRVSHGVIADRAPSEPGRTPVQQRYGGRWYLGPGSGRRPLFVSGRSLVAWCARRLSVRRDLPLNSDWIR